MALVKEAGQKHWRSLRVTVKLRDKLLAGKKPKSLKFRRGDGERARP